MAAAVTLANGTHDSPVQKMYLGMRSYLFSRLLDTIR